MAFNSSNKEKTIKNMYQSMMTDSWIIDKTLLYGNYNNKAILVIGNILDNYSDYFEQYLETVDVPEEYFYQPTAFSNYFYGTPDLDFLVLYFARISSLFQFNKSRIKVLPRERLNEFNKLMTEYKKEVSSSYANPEEFKEIAKIETQKKMYI